MYIRKFLSSRTGFPYELYAELFAVHTRSGQVVIGMALTSYFEVLYRQGGIRHVLLVVFEPASQALLPNLATG